MITVKHSRIYSTERFKDLDLFGEQNQILWKIILKKVQPNWNNRWNHAERSLSIQKTEAENQKTFGLV